MTPLDRTRIKKAAADCKAAAKMLLAADENDFARLLKEHRHG